MQNQYNKQLKRQNLTNAMLALREELCNTNSGGREGNAGEGLNHLYI